MSLGLVMCVEATGVGTEEPFHPNDEIRLRGFDNQVEVIGKQTESMDIPSGLCASFLERSDEHSAIRVVPRNRLAMVPAARYMVVCLCNLDPWTSGHGKNRHPN